MSETTQPKPKLGRPRKPPISVKDIEQLKASIMKAGDKETAQIYHIKAQALRHTLKAEVEAGELVSLKAIDERDTKNAAAVAAAHRKAEMELPAMLAGLSEAQIVKTLRAYFREIDEMLSDAQSEFWTEHKTAK